MKITITIEQEEIVGNWHGTLLLADDHGCETMCRISEPSAFVALSMARTIAQKHIDNSRPCPAGMFADGGFIEHPPLIYERESAGSFVPLNGRIVINPR